MKEAIINWFKSLCWHDFEKISIVKKRKCLNREIHTIQSRCKKCGGYKVSDYLIY